MRVVNRSLVVCLSEYLPLHRATLKKSLFPVQRVAIIMASWEATNFFFVNMGFFRLYRNNVENAGKKEKSLKREKNVHIRHL